MTTYTSSPCPELESEIARALEKFKGEPYANPIFNTFLSGIVTNFYFSNQLSGNFCANCLKTVIDRLRKPEVNKLLLEAGVDTQTDIMSIFQSLHRIIPTVGDMYKSRIFEEIPGIYCRFFFKYLISGS